MITPGEADSLLYAGVAPAALFTSTDGESWALNEPLWKERQAGECLPVPAGSACTRSAPGPAIPSASPSV